MSVTYATPLSLEVRPSLIVKIFLLVVHLLAVLSLFLLSLPWYAQLPLMLGLAFVYAYSLRQYSVDYQLHWGEDAWLISTDTGEHAAELLASSVITAWLAILNFRLDNGRSLSVLLLPDAIHAEQFRRLRVRLKVSGNKAGAHARMTP